MGTAKYLEFLDHWRGNARLYRLDPPYDFSGKEIEYVVVSATVPYEGPPETVIFPANENGDAITYVQLSGSYRGGLDHEEALRNAGYEVT